ncbi:serine/threonine-protein kinase [Nocardia sp. NPDC052566]|uniref:serine/threonine-protein kinase n=1 Tax=Nocardia sp. NPDC052566 TaxID=3364330 RepID=UPI0037C86AA9
MLRSGEMFADYVIERELGRGGMGTVYLVRHPRLPRLIVLKVLNPELFSDAESRARFEREAELAARLDHPNIVSVYDRGAVGEQLWIAMQYVEGPDASRIPLPMPADRAVRIIEEVAEGLDYAHRKGVLHRDVKPANILLDNTMADRPERVLLADFGIARLRDDAGHLTRTGTFTATLAFASPEQLSGASLDAGADQYSLACTLFRFLTGHAPFEAEHPAVVMQGHLYDAAPIATAIRPELSPGLDAVLTRAMAKRPENRFASCAEFAAAARRALTEWAEPDTTEPIARTAVPQPAIRPVTVDPLAPNRSRTMRRVVIAGAALLAVALAVVTGVLIASSDSEPDRVQTSAGDLAAISKAFPKMVPYNTDVKRGYNESYCNNAARGDNRVDGGPDFFGLALGEWTTAWECGGGGDHQDPTFILFAYKSSTDVEAVVARLNPASKFTASNGGRSYTNYRVKGFWRESIVTVFLGTGSRAPFLMYSHPRYSDEQQDLIGWWQQAPLG